MPVSLSIKNVPDDLLERLHERARRNHRSLQGELMAILSAAVEPTPRHSIAEIRTMIRALELPATDVDSVDIIRGDRDDRGSDA